MCNKMGAFGSQVSYRDQKIKKYFPAEFYYYSYFCS